MNIPDLKKALNEGIVLFEFIKIDGSLRPVRGTTCPDLVPTPDTPKGVRTPEQLYDIDKKAWRSMRIDALWSYQRALKLTD